jgi:hypothetical protein
MTPNIKGKGSIWDQMKLESVTSYRSHPRLKVKDRVTVVLDMPIRVYSEFRRQVEAPGSFTDRRADDQAPQDSNPKSKVPRPGSRRSKSGSTQQPTGTPSPTGIQAA